MNDPTGLEFLVASGSPSFTAGVKKELTAIDTVCEATVVESAGKAVEQADNTVDGVIVDDRIDTPIDTVNQIAAGDGTDVVFLTDRGADRTVERALDAGATDVFPRTTAGSQYELIVDRVERSGHSSDTDEQTDRPTRDASQQPYREVFENVSDGLVIHDPTTGEMLDVNDQFCELNGYDRDELVGESIGLVTAPGDEYNEVAAQEMIDLARREGPQLFEWRNQRKNGETFPVEVHLAVVQIDSQDRVLASVRDITERTERERKLEERERRFRLIAEHIDEIIYLATKDFSEILYINPAYEDIYGRSVENLYENPQSFVEAAHPDDRERYEQDVRQIIKEIDAGDPDYMYEGEYRLLQDGETRWVRVARFPVENDDGTVDRIVGRVQDITEKRRREREFEQIFNGVQDAIVVHDPENAEIVDVNDTFCDIMGYSREKLIELGTGGFSVNEEGYTQERAKEVIAEVEEHGESGPFEWKVETKSGEHRVMEVITTMAQIGGEPRHISINRDITERKRREQEYQQIFNMAGDGIVIHDPESGEVIDANRQIAELLGYSREAFVNLSLSEFQATDEDVSGERARKMIQQSAAEGGQEFEWPLETADGETVWVRARHEIGDIGGERRIVAHLQDITERRQREREYEQIFNNVNDTIAVHDRDTGAILDVNQKMCELTGYDKETALELGAEGLVYDHPSQDYAPEEIPSIIERVMDGEEIEPYEQVLQTSDGDLVWVEVNPTRAVIGGEERFVAISRDVTERRRRELEYEQIFNNVNDIIAVRDPENGEIIDVNQSYADLLGYDREEMQGMTISQVGVPEDGYDEEQGMEHLKTVLESDQPVEFEWKVEGADGRLHHMDVRGTAAVINGDRRYLAIGRDITERKRRERAINRLRKATERLQSATTHEEVATVAVETASEVLNLPMAVCWIDDEDTDVLTPAAATDGVHDTDLVSEVSPDRYEYEAFVEGEVTEYTPRKQSGDYPFETGVLLPLAHHGLIAAVTHQDTRVDETVLDIAKALADHVTTALDRIERDQAVRESERRFRLIADRVDEIIYLADADTRDVLYLSPGHEEIWGRSLDDPQTFTDDIHSEDIDSFMTAREEMFADIEAGNPDESYQFDYRIERPDGELRWIETTGYPILGTDDSRNRYVALIKDVTERKYREQRLEVFNRILRHNLRNQLDVIRSYAEELADRTEDDHADQIINATDELAEIGRSAREIDRIMSMEKTPSEIDIAESLRETVDAMDWNRGGVTVTTEFPNEVCLRTDEQSVTMAVESALENAVENAASAVTVAVENSKDKCLIEIEDDGPGIPEEALTPIQVGRESPHQHGSGLGLWQIRWCVDALNGDLTFETGNGTTVRITVPDQRESV